MEGQKRDTTEIKNKILSVLRTRGPTLPVHIAKETNLSMIFASAFLSELVNNHEAKMSIMRVGGSPVYFLKEHQNQLENFSNYLPGKEREAYSMLKEKKLLEDRDLEPAIRVAIRNIKDFAYPLILNLPEGQRTFWRFSSFLEEEAKKMIETIVEGEKPKIVEEKKQEVKVEIKEPEKLEVPEIKVREIEVKPEIRQEKKEHKIREKQVLELEEKPVIELKILPDSLIEKPKVKEKSPFAQRIIELFGSKDIEIIEEKDSQKKDYLAIVRINSQIGKIRLLAVCKDKKRLNEQDIIAALQKSQEHKLPVLMVAPGSLDKKAEVYAGSYSGWFNFLSIDS